MPSAHSATILCLARKDQAKGGQSPHGAPVPAVRLFHRVLIPIASLIPHCLSALLDDTSIAGVLLRPLSDRPITRVPPACLCRVAQLWRGYVEWSRRFYPATRWW